MPRDGQAATARVGPVEGPWKLPEGWKWKRLSEITDEPERGDPARSFPKLFRYLDVSGIEGAQISPKILPSATAPSRARQFVRPGDTILSGVRVYLRNLALIGENGPDVASTAFCVLRPRAGLNPRYLYRWVSSDYFISTLMPLQGGNSPPAVLDADVRAQLIPIPPTIDHQSRIADRIDALFTGIDDGERALAEVRVGMETYRKALLKAAVTGDLTAEWRRANPPAETGQDLLRRILADRRVRWEADAKNRGKRYVEPSRPEMDGLPELPASWQWISLDQISSTDPRNGLSIKEAPAPTEVRALRLSALASEIIDWTQTRYLPRALSEVAAYSLEEGDLLVSRANGSPDLVGKASLCVEPPGNTIFPDTAIRYRLGANSALNHWVVTVWNSDFARIQLCKRAKTTAGILKVSQDDIRSVAIPLSSLAELGELERILQNALNEVRRVARSVPQLVNLSGTLQQSILAAAFRGDLVA